MKEPLIRRGTKFRGQRSLLEPGISWLEERTGIPVIGAIPWLEHVFPSEDSLDLLERKSSKTQSDINVAVNAYLELLILPTLTRWNQKPALR